MINHFFKELIQVDKLSIKTLKYVYSLIINNEKSINFIGQSLFHSFYYLCIKSAKLELYLLGHPFLSEAICSAEQETDHYMEKVNYEYDGYDIRKYLNPKVFNFEFIFGKCNKNNNNEDKEEEDFGASFDEILKQLIFHISHLPSLSDNQMVSYENIIFKHDYFRNGLFNFNLEYYLKIKRVDLFLKELEYIQQFENTLSQYQKQLSQNNPDTPSTYQFKLDGFFLDSKSIELADRVLDEESFQLFISLNSYATIIKSLKIEMEDNDGKKKHDFVRYKSIINKILIDNGIDGFWSASSSSEVLINQELFTEINSFKIIRNLNLIKSFNTSFNPCYHLQFHQLLFKLFPLNDQPLITIDISDVDKAIVKKKINFLKFYIENNLIKNDKVIQYLKLKLSNHYDFKYININWPQ